MSSENHCSIVSSKGLLKSCDIYHPNTIFDSHEDGTVIYICNRDIRDFILNVDRMKYKFILVSGDSDETIPTSVLDDNEFLKFMNNDNLIHWFSQNCVSNHRKITKMPIGMDYHSITEGKIEWGKNISPIDQEKELEEIVASSLPFHERKVECFSNFHFSIHAYSPLGYSRSQVIEEVPNDLVYYTPEYSERLVSWQKQVEYAFVLSPCGNGIDCHRTWEALALGCIPIVKKSLMDDIYDGLPVLIVDNWSDITKDLLEKTISDFKSKVFLTKKTTLKYWVDKINTVY